jgi:hypothetical protein
MSFKLNKADLKRFKEIKNRLSDVESRHADAIENGEFIRMTAKVFEESRWLANRIDVALGEKTTEEVAEEEAERELAAAEAKAGGEDDDETE